MASSWQTLSYTPTPTSIQDSESNEIINLLKKDLLQSIQDGVEHFKSLMDQILETNQALKHSQLQKHYLQNSKIIVESFSLAYANILEIIDSDIKHPVEQLILLAKTRLDASLRKLFTKVYVRKHEIQLDDIKKIVKEFTNQADMLYNERMEEPHEGIDWDWKNPRKVKIIHDNWCRDATQLFIQLLKDKSIELENEKFWILELKHRLNEYLQDLLENCECPKEERLPEQPITNQRTTKKLYPDLNALSFDSVNEDSSLPSGGSYPQTVDNKNAEPFLGSNTDEGTPLDIGIYFDEHSFQIGVYHPNAKRTSRNQPVSNFFQKVLSIYPTISFSHEGIIVGKPVNPISNKDSNYYFNVFELVTSRSTSAKTKPITISIQKHQFKLCPYLITAAFFHQVLRSFETKNNVKIKKIIFTTPLTPTIALKRSILESLKMAGFLEIRFFSSILTLALSTLDSSEHSESIQSYNSVIVKSMYVLAVDIQEQSFSMGIVKFCLNKIFTISTYGSDNISECTTTKFRTEHKNLFYNKNSEAESDSISNDCVRPPYDKAINYVLNNAFHNVETVCLENVVINNIGSLRTMVLGILRHKVSINNIDSMFRDSLLGASILAAVTSNSELPREIRFMIPSGIDVSDCSRSDLRLYSRFKKDPTDQNEFPFKEKMFKEGSIVFCQDYSVPVAIDSNNENSASFSLALYELHGPEECIFEVCTYNINYLCSPHNYIGFDLILDKHFQLSFKCIEKKEGILTLRPYQIPDSLTYFQMMNENECFEGCEDYQNYRKMINLYGCKREGLWDFS